MSFTLQPTPFSYVLPYSKIIYLTGVLFTTIKNKYLYLCFIVYKWTIVVNYIVNLSNTTILCVNLYNIFITYWFTTFTLQPTPFSYVLPYSKIIYLTGVLFTTIKNKYLYLCFIVYKWTIVVNYIVNLSNTTILCVNLYNIFITYWFTTFTAEREGFEPPYLSVRRFSRPL